MQHKEGKNKLQKQNSFTFLDFTCNCVYIFSISSPNKVWTFNVQLHKTSFFECRHLAMSQALSNTGNIHFSKWDSYQAISFYCLVTVVLKRLYKVMPQHIFLWKMLMTPSGRLYGTVFFLHIWEIQGDFVSELCLTLTFFLTMANSPLKEGGSIRCTRVALNSLVSLCKAQHPQA